MLEGMRLSDKLTVAREWFRRSRSGEFEFTHRHADVFVELLEQCQHDAIVLEHGPDPASGGDNVVKLFELADASAPRSGPGQPLGGPSPSRQGGAA